MCPSCNGDAPATSNPNTNGMNGQANDPLNGQTNGRSDNHIPHNPRSQPFATVGDYLSRGVSICSYSSLIEPYLGARDESNAFTY